MASDNIADLVIAYVNEQNRPLNSQIIADMLQKSGVKKTSAQKALDAAASSGQISSKEYGKQKIFLAKQDQFEIPSKEELESMKKENDKLLEEARSAQRECSVIEAEVRDITSSLTSEEIEENIKRLCDENKAMEAKLIKLREGTVRISVDEKVQVDERYTVKTATWKQRKRVFNNLWGMVCENMQKNSKEFADELGIETDTDLGVDIEQYCNLEAKKPRRQ